MTTTSLYTTGYHPNCRTKPRFYRSRKEACVKKCGPRFPNLNG